MTKQILRLENIKAGYGKKEILHNIFLEIHEREIVALIGANGSGKSTVLKVAAGLLSPSQGRIFFNSNDITTWNCNTRVKKGIVYFIQGGEVFPSLTVQENLDIGLIGSSSRRKDKFEEVYELFPDIKLWLDKRAGLLSGGQRQQVALAMVLLKKPKIMLLDEPSAGLAPNLVKEIMHKVKLINQLFSSSLLIVEQNVGEVLRIAQKVILLSNGKILSHTDTPKEFYRREILEQMFF